MTAETADSLCAELDLGSDVRDALLEFPTKGNSLEGKLVPTDPLLYRFYEILCVYGKSLKDSIQEKCGDGIMSAIDFTLDVKKVEHSHGDRRHDGRQVLAVRALLKSRLGTPRRHDAPG